MKNEIIRHVVATHSKQLLQRRKSYYDFSDSTNVESAKISESELFKDCATTKAFSDMYREFTDCRFDITLANVDVGEAQIFHFGDDGEYITNILKEDEIYELLYTGPSLELLAEANVLIVRVYAGLNDELIDIWVSQLFNNNLTYRLTPAIKFNQHHVDSIEEYLKQDIDYQKDIGLITLQFENKYEVSTHTRRNDLRQQRWSKLFILFIKRRYKMRRWMAKLKRVMNYPRNMHDTTNLKHEYKPKIYELWKENFPNNIKIENDKEHMEYTQLKDEEVREELQMRCVQECECLRYRSRHKRIGNVVEGLTMKVFWDAMCLKV